MYNLLLSPHPDDLVFSCFSALCEPSEKRAIEFFNVSRYTRFKFKSKNIVSVYRTLEDKLILGLFGVKVSFLFMKDTSLSQAPQRVGAPDLKSILPKTPPNKIFCPLGLGGHRNHLAVRQSGIQLWRSWSKESKLFFYEDLPYATYDLTGTKHELEDCLDELEPLCGKVEVAWRPLSICETKKKLLTSRAYFSQTNLSNLLLMHARELGKQCGGEFAEKFFVPEQLSSRIWSFHDLDVCNFPPVAYNALDVVTA